jgi:benzoyl-CoA reductase/2-hydroxyglutaryl-CoA dehydratase subunit BcrC/BadD/HgdB
VGDNLANSKRLAWNAYPCKKESIYADIAAHILQHQSSPSISGFSTLWKQDYAEIKRKKVKGVLFLCRKFCEPYDYLFVLYEARLQSAGIPLLRVYVDNDEEHSNAVFETFAEML